MADWKLDKFFRHKQFSALMPSSDGTKHHKALVNNYFKKKKNKMKNKIKKT